MDFEDLIEGFVSLIVVLVLLSLLIQVQFGIDTTNIVNSIIELLIPLFMGGFISLILIEIVKSISS